MVALVGFLTFKICLIAYSLSVLGLHSSWRWLAAKLGLNRFEKPLNRLQDALGRFAAIIFIWMAIAFLLMLVTASKLVIISLPTAVCVALLWLSSRGR